MRTKAVGELPGGLTNGQCSAILFYMIRKEPLVGRDPKTVTKYKKYLENPRKYVKLQEALDSRAMEPTDRWTEAEAFLGLAGQEEGFEEPCSTSASTTTLLQKPDYHLGGEGRSGLGAARGGQKTGRLGRPAAGSGQGEQGNAPDNLEVDSDDVAGQDAAVVHCKAQEMVGREGVMGGDHGLAHPLDMLMSKLKKAKKEAVACLECGERVQHYCQSCLLAGYCSATCQLLHWQGDHSEDCATWAARLHGGAGLVPPPPDESLALRAARKARARDRNKTHSTVVMHRDTLEKLEESEKEVATRRDEMGTMGRQM